MKRILFILIPGLFLLFSCTDKKISTVIIENKVEHQIDDRLFGHFLEKCSWHGEIGGDLVINSKTGEFDTTIMKHLKSMNIPVIRYPGGTDVDYFSWTDLIDHAPGQTKRKPYRAYRHKDGDSIVSDNRLGLNEFVNLCRELDAEPIYVLNIGDAFYKKITIQQAKENAAAVLAYSNLTEGVSDTNWPEYRRKNGNEDPLNIKFWQIGNESWGFKGIDWKYVDRDPALIKHLYDCIIAVADTLKSLDPSIKIIADGPFEQMVSLHEENSKGLIDYLVFHVYMPWGINEVFNNDSILVDPSELVDELTWNAWVSTPAIDSETGMSTLWMDDAAKYAISTTFDLAVTEWNWNGWFGGQYLKAGLTESDLAIGIGAAGFLHAFMRRGDRIKMACQSMTVGKAWGITGIRVDPNYEQQAVMLPSGQITGLYASHHGKDFLSIDYKNIPTFEQPFQMNAIVPQKKVAQLDVLATKSDNQLFVHVINRSFKNDHDLSIELNGLNVMETYKMFTLIGDPLAQVSNRSLEQNANIEESVFDNGANSVKVNIPHSTVSVLVFDLK